MSPDTVVLANTPGTYYAFAYWLASAVYIAVNPRRLEGKRRLGVQAAFLLLLVGTAYLTRAVPLWLWLPSILAEFALCGLALAACCDLPPENILYYTVRSIMLGEFAASLEWQLYYYGLHSLHLPNVWQSAAAFLLVTHGAVFGVMYWLERRFRQENRKLQINRKELVTVLLIFVIVFVISNLSYVVSGSPFSSVLSSDLFIIRTITDLGGVGILFSYHMQLHELTSRMELEKLHAITRMQYASYKISEDSIAMVNRKYHDLKHQIQLLRYEASSDEKRQYLDRMEEEIRSYEAQNKTGNKVLDAVLSVKSMECQRKMITMTCMVDGAALNFVDPMDLSALFGNALDNAIESTQKIEEEDRRMIQVQVQRQKQFVKVKIRNCCQGEVPLRDGIPVTTKRDKRYHGFGIRSMQTTVNKYGGALSIQVQNGWFELSVLFPIGQVDKETSGSYAHFAQ